MLPINTRVVNVNGDAIKTVYSLVYYVQHGGGNYSNAMLYPYGEHINYYDLIPLVALLLRGIYLLVPMSPAAIIAGMNLALLLTLIGAPLVLFAVLRRLGLPAWVAIPAALVLVYLSPQQGRLTTHPSLFAPLVVPALWYGLMRMLEQPRQWRWPLAYVLVAVGAALMHTYFLLISGVLAGGSALALLLQDPLRTVRARLLPLLIGAVVPLGAFRIWLALTDHVADRPLNPYGTFVYTSRPSSIFLPSQGFWHNQIAAIHDWKLGPWEGFAYVGIPGVLVLLFSMWRFGQRLMRGQWQQLRRPMLPRPLRTALVAGVLALLLAMSFPFILPGGEALLIGPVKQFRALGRMAWLFYYVYTVYAVYYLYQLYRCLAWRHHTWAGAALLALSGLIWTSEAWENVRPVRDTLAQQTTAREYTADEYLRLLNYFGRQPTDFQAVLPLPWYCVGTDKLAIEAHGEVLRQSSRVMMNTGLPQAAVMMTRTSVGETLNLAQLLANPLLPRSLAAQLPSRKPFLLLVLRGAWLTPNEQSLLQRAKLLGEGWVANLYELPADSLVSSEPARALRQLAAAKGSMRRSADSLLWLNGSGTALYQSFDSLPANPGLFGRGALVAAGRPYDSFFTTVYEGAAPADTGRYEASIWIQATRAHGLGNFQAKTFDGQGQQQEHTYVNNALSTDIYHGWVRVAVPVHVRPDTRRLQLLVDNPDLAADELLIRPAGTDVFHHHGAVWLKNNFPLNSAR
ncbi:hypothetical protein GCM10028821_11130 [Hymenobacter jeollabukensis]